MKKLILLPFLFLMLCLVNAQPIMNLRTSPNYPEPTDDVLVIMDLTFNSGGCDMQFSNFSRSNDTITVNVFHCPGPLTVICNTVDTVNIGTYNLGTYVLKAVVHLANNSTPDPCSNHNPQDSAYTTFQIILVPGIPEEKLNSGFRVLYHEQENFIEIASELSNYEFTLYSADGKIIESRSLSGRAMIPSHTFSEGIYFYSITQKGNKESGKIRIHR
ncbi:MAG: T9SS C-terminal target domain-containing protein [Bacteroidetes bacterium]|nr:MAG: T9SS C-terminal target domain-containing protein [Bacteroidota bacterium]REK06955.1 MAG: T9SS C-terminal target domain-containing protein [Bacteroidota bacterium]REK33697.1 MAG: T9SS C-terminal target domain-containing protein [Bacteroidota bacterium]REK47226.1 MAG: T9SS C-terminal target domain-containing protein [Bacteroidota bacterium]